MLNLKNNEKFYDAVFDEFCEKSEDLKKLRILFWIAFPGWKLTTCHWYRGVWKVSQNLVSDFYIPISEWGKITLQYI